MTAALADASTGLEAPDRAGQNSPWRIRRDLLRKTAYISAFLATWQIYTAASESDDLVLAAPSEVAQALWTGMLGGDLHGPILGTLQYLSIGLVVGVVLAAILTSLAHFSGALEAAIGLATATFTPLPGVALIPVAVLWLGVGPRSLIVVIVNAVVWPVVVNFQAGFRSTHPVFLMAGGMLGLSRSRLTRAVIVPASLPHIVTGLKTGWIFAWRTAISAELIFGASGSSGGLGVYINNASLFMNVDDVFAGLLIIAVLGIAMESIFNEFERRTVIKWGMKVGAR